MKIRDGLKKERRFFWLFYADTTEAKKMQKLAKLNFWSQYLLVVIDLGACGYNYTSFSRNGTYFTNEFGKLPGIFQSRFKSNGYSENPT